ncbi:MAG: RNA 2'-phosphotransferase [Lachnospiraceae bacterium]|nr:RNA 2'-phosphotransferase [Lachnospiraceae bacterium]
MKSDEISVYFCYLLRHKPEEAHLAMDEHGWVDFEEFVSNVNTYGKYTVTADDIIKIVETDQKSRYKLDIQDGVIKRIKCCQGHSIPWVTPELTFTAPPDQLYHGTTENAYQKILKSGKIDKMSRHAVHTHPDLTLAWQSARRRKLPAVVLVIDAKKMAEDGYRFGVTENGVWCIDEIPVEYISDVLR